MQVIWKNPKQVPQLERGKDIKVWALVDFYRYTQEYGGLGQDGKAERILTLQEKDRRVIEMRYATAGATDAELAEFNETGNWPENSDGWLDDWVNEDGEFNGVDGFYREYHEEGSVYYDVIEKDKDGKMIIKHSYGLDEPGMILLAWAEFERPTVPENITE